MFPRPPTRPANPQPQPQPQPPLHIHSRDNPLLKTLRRLTQSSGAYRKEGQLWLEGDHLCRAAQDKGWALHTLVVSESFWQLRHENIGFCAIKTIVIDDALFASISALESPAAVGALLPRPPPPALQPGLPTLVLDRVQDAGNVGSMLRSAAAFGFAQVLALPGTAALWSPKVLRAGMGAHFSLRLLESASLADVQALRVPLVVTSSHQGQFLHQQPPPAPCALVMGHEGQGVSAELLALAQHAVRIAQPGGQESLNVAAAAAICLHGIALARG